ncbi:MAG TPA: M56 family metallopeptidase [Candidatus Dormibacteraeota bacterium]|nr:M56 family metallopeptidase [Candidatus Dormibacteraeota bacterium]
MSLPAAPAMDSVWFHYVLEPAARALILAAVVWFLFAAFRIKGISLRLAAWTVILYAALAMPFLSRIVPEVALPVLSAQTARPAAGHFALSKTPAIAPVTQFAVYHPEEAARAGAPRTDAQSPADAAPAATSGNTGAARNRFWLSIAIVVYLLVMAIFLARFALGLVSSRRLRRASAPILDERLRRLLARESRQAGLEKPPPLAESAVLSVPATLGLFRHVILLPVEWDEWDQAQTTAVLAHELSHIARRDGLTQALSRLHRAFFWFSPLSWWLDRTLVDLAEQASDDAALRSGADRIGYAEVLLHFFRALRAAHGRVRWEGVSMAQGSLSRRRVERILENSPLSRGLGLAALGAVVLAVAPLICLAAAVQPSRVAAIPASLLATAPPPPPRLALTPASVPARATPAASPAERRVSVPHRAQGEGRPNGMGCRGGEAFAVVSGRFAMSECASASELDGVWNLRGQVPGSFVWFHRDGRNYVVDDPATVKAAFVAFAPLLTIEQQRAVLVWKENGLVRDQVALAMWRMAAGFETPDFGTPIRELEARLLAIESATTPAESARAQAEFARAEWDAMQSGITQMEWARMKRAEAEDPQSAGQLEAALVAQQEALGRAQAELERQQAQTARQASELARKLIGRSLLEGLARSL